MKPLVDLVDFHAHVLPGADHGSSSLETSIRQMEFAVEFGVKGIVATPHFYPAAHTVESFIERRDRAYRLLCENLSGIELRKGAEVLICNGLCELPGLEKLFVENTRVLLLELPFSDFQSEYCDTVYSLVKNDVTVILAHADRYPRDRIERLIDVGARLQLNADAVSGIFVRRHLIDWLNRDLVYALGSDIHGEDRRAYKTFRSAKYRLTDYIERIKEHSDKIFYFA